MTNRVNPDRTTPSWQSSLVCLCIICLVRYIRHTSSYSKMDSLKGLDNLGKCFNGLFLLVWYNKHWPVHCIDPGMPGYTFKKKYYNILSEKKLFTFTNSVDYDAAFYLGLYCLQKYSFKGFPNTKVGQLKMLKNSIKHFKALHNHHMFICLY